MMRLACVVFLLLVTGTAHAQHGHTPSTATAPAPALTGVGGIRHPVSTRNAEAQRYFDQGLNLSFAFNHDEAFRAFQRASQLDPQLAMATWGMALVLGPNINLPIDEPRSKQAYELVQKAVKQAAKAPESEKAYVQALAKRYAADPKADRAKLDVAYKEAMGELSRRYPDDLDAATLYAEAAMDLRPWQYWMPDGKPNEGTVEIVEVLQSVLRRNPDHIGANHLLIHAVEASPHPELALGAARRLEGAAPGAGHLVHMPTHIYARVGDHEASAKLNEQAAEVDRDYITKHKVEGIYPAMYFNHNMHFAAYSNAARGNYKGALRSATDVYDHASPAVKEMPMLELFTPTPLLVQVRFRRWEDVLKVSDPGETMPITRGVWRFGRGMAYAAKGDAARAAEERRALETQIGALPAEAMVGFNPGKSILGIAAALLDARIAESAKQDAKALEALNRAVAAEDQLAYDEPPDWYLHARESLGGFLLRSGKPVEAEKAFRADLDRNFRNGRSLFGLAQSLRAQGKTWASASVDQEFQRVWKDADVKLTVDDL
ncbi:MAG TPA: hypothetical protein VFQ05_02930 [Candidatus Eisenbacteria bacterium]|nr:hypothetical protein [Candidatus Eisenbacteria bacterium]